MLAFFPLLGFSQLIHDASFEATFSNGASGEQNWAVCNGHPDAQVLDGFGSGIFGVHTPAAQGQRYVGLLDTDFELRESIGQFVDIEAGSYHYGNVALFRSTAHQNWNGTGQLQIWGGSDCGHLTELLWSSGTVSNVDEWQYYSINFQPLHNHQWLSLMVMLDAGSGEMTYLCVDDLHLDNQILAFDFVDFQAAADAAAVQLSWETMALEEAKSFAIDWSHDGLHFETIGQVAGSVGQSAFHFETSPSAIGQQYYRIQTTDLAGRTYASEIREVNWGVQKLQVYPNPIAMGSGSLKLNLPEWADQTIHLRLLDLHGQTVMDQSIAHALHIEVALPADLAPGCYQLQIAGGGSLHQQGIVVIR